MRDQREYSKNDSKIVRFLKNAWEYLSYIFSKTVENNNKNLESAKAWVTQIPVHFMSFLLLLLFFPRN